MLPTNRAVGVGYVENDFRGADQKFLLYAQYGTQQSLAFAAFLDPAVHGSKLTYRLDLYYENKLIYEYLNPTNDPTNFNVARTTCQQFFDGGALIGWNWTWWLGADLRFRTGYAEFADFVDASGNPTTRSEKKDGFDTTAPVPPHARPPHQQARRDVGSLRPAHARGQRPRPRRLRLLRLPAARLLQLALLG